MEVATSYETARLVVAGRSSALQIIGVAAPPDRPMPRNVARHVAVGFGGGLVFASIIVLISHGLSTARTPRSNPL
jgi:hypothetical protein